jgi:hypothetical protein
MHISSTSIYGCNHRSHTQTYFGLLFSWLSFVPSWYSFSKIWCWFVMRGGRQCSSCFSVRPLFSSPEIDNLFTEMTPISFERSDLPGSPSCLFSTLRSLHARRIQGDCVEKKKGIEKMRFVTMSGGSANNSALLLMVNLVLPTICYPLQRCCTFQFISSRQFMTFQPHPRNWSFFGHVLNM